MYTLFTFVTLKCNTCNKTSTFEPGVHTECMKPTCKCNDKVEVKKTTRKRIRKVQDEN